MIKKDRTSIQFFEIGESESILAAVKVAVNAALLHEDAEDRFLSIVLTNDEIIHEYNRRFRSVDRATDVLSFPVDEGDDLLALPDGFLGDIMISVPRAKEQGIALGHSLEDEIVFLTVHGILHLLGYDHIMPSDEERMLPIQREIVNGVKAR